MKTSRILWLPLALAVVAAGTLPLQARTSGEEVVRLEEWPELDKEAKKSVPSDIARLRKARTPEMGAEAQEALLDVGAGVVPQLLPTLGKEKDADAIERIEAVLLGVTDASHTRLLAREFGHKQAAIRKWSLMRAASFPDSGIRAEAEKAVETARKNLAKKKADEDELYAASLAATSSGSLAGMEAISERAEAKWERYGAEIRTALEAVRGPEATGWVAGLLEEAGDERIIAALHLLAGCGEKESAVPHVRPFLDSEHSQVRVAAINALRGIVDGALPIQNLSAFDAIEMANEWKGRL